MCHMSHVRCHMSLYSLSQTVRAKDLQFSYAFTLCVKCHMSLIMCHVSHVMCHIFLFLSKWLIWLVEALLSTGPTPSSFQTFSYYKRTVTEYLLISAFSGLFWVLKKNKFNIILFQEDCNSNRNRNAKNLQLWRPLEHVFKSQILGSKDCCGLSVIFYWFQIFRCYTLSSILQLQDSDLLTNTHYTVSKQTIHQTSPIPKEQTRMQWQSQFRKLCRGKSSAEVN